MSRDERLSKYFASTTPKKILQHLLPKKIIVLSMHKRCQNPEQNKKTSAIAFKMMDPEKFFDNNKKKTRMKNTDMGRRDTLSNSIRKNRHRMPKTSKGRYILRTLSKKIPLGEKWTYQKNRIFLGIFFSHSTQKRGMPLFSLIKTNQSPS